jgi:orotate phosphoribosyltransferase
MFRASFSVITVTDSDVTGADYISLLICFLPTAMDQNVVLAMYRQSGALLEGHFRLTSGLHSAGYMQSALVLQHPKEAEVLGRGLAELLREYAPTVVLSPALGGLIIGHEVARGLGVRAIFAERVEGKLTLRRGFSLAPTDRVVVIEDVVTTAGSTRETIAVAEAAGATVVAAGSMVDRSGGQTNLTVPFRALATLSLAAYDPTACPLCAAGQPVVKPGSRT